MFNNYVKQKCKLGEPNNYICASVATFKLISN